jgi:subtilisin family serine protease
LRSRRRVAGGMDFEERAQFAIWVERQGGRVHRWLPLIQGLAYSLPAERRPIRAYRAGTWDEPDVIVRALGAQSTALAPETTWNLRAIEAPLLWDRSKGAGVEIAIVDTGIDLDHPGLHHVADGYNALAPGDSPDDDNGHGTHVAGIAAGEWETGSGVAPEATVLPVKVLDDQGMGSLSDVVDGLHWCLQRRAPIINLSLGSSQPTQSMKAAIEALWEAGLLVVAAAGNEGPRCSTVSYPAKWEEVLAVAASTESSLIATFSSRGSQVDVTAPGQSILSLWPDGGVRYLSGTSMAAPHVSGAAALLWDLASHLPTPLSQTRELARPLLEGSCPLPGFTCEAQGQGLLHALASAALLET